MLAHQLCGPDYTSTFCVHLPTHPVPASQEVPAFLPSGCRLRKVITTGLAWYFQDLLFQVSWLSVPGWDFWSDLGPQTPKLGAEKRMVPQSGCSGLGALTSENQAGHRVAAPVLLHIGEVAGPRQQATEHGSAAQACGAEGAGARDTATTTRPAFRSAMATPRERSLRCASAAETWSARDARLRVGQGTPTGRILPSRPAWVRPQGGGPGGARMELTPSPSAGALF